MVVYVFQPLAQGALRPAAVVRNLEDDVRDVYAVHVLRIADDLAVIHPLRYVRTHTLPGRPLVVRAKDAASLPCGLDRGVDDVVISRRNGQSDAPQVTHRQSTRSGPQPGPRRAAVGGFVNRALGAAVDQRVEMAAALPARRVNDVGIRRIERDVGDAGVFADAQDGLPRLGAVGGLVQAAITARGPQRPLRGDVDDLAVARVNHDAADMFGLFEADLAEAAAAVLGFVNPVAVADAALAVAFARPDPDHGRVFRIERDRADRIRPVIVEDRSPGGSRVDGLPHAARCDGDEIFGAVMGVNGERDDAPGSDRRADGTEPKAGEGRRRHRIRRT